MAKKILIVTDDAGEPGYLIQADLAIARVKAADYEAVLVIGGRAPEFLRHNDKLLKIVQEFSFLLAMIRDDSRAILDQLYENCFSLFGRARHLGFALVD